MQAAAIHSILSKILKDSNTPQENPNFRLNQYTVNSHQSSVISAQGKVSLMDEYHERNILPVEVGDCDSLTKKHN